MADLFKFEKYGTFTGPAATYEYNDEEPQWWQTVPTDVSFKLSDIGIIFFNNEADYAYFHLYGTSTSLVTLEKNSGDLPNLLANIQNTVFNGKIIVNDKVVCNDDIVASGNVLCNGVVNISGVGNASSYMQATRSIAQSKKPFDILHPTKEGHRLRYVSLEGPAAEVYFRGTLKGSNYIELPDYWKGLVDPETITANLTPIGTHQELYYEQVEWGTRIKVVNSAGGSIHCSYTVFGERKDTTKNIPEYKGLTPNDYPGDNEEYNLIN
jgi:hypothetical protein